MMSELLDKLFERFHAFSKELRKKAKNENIKRNIEAGFYYGIKAEVFEDLVRIYEDVKGDE